MLKGCSPCQHNQRAYVKEPLTLHDIPPKPWHTLGSDFFFLNNKSYLVVSEVSDYYSKFPLIRKLRNIQVKHCYYTQFTSSGFTEFSKACGFEQVTTSPYYSQANGFIERNVQAVKNLLQKCKESGSDPHLAMLCVRTTPVNHHLPSPAEILNSRTYQSNLPSLCKPTLFPKIDRR
ncbi:Retrovirus-related Pol poly from transposon [Paramuricea clavata]|uniref:Retrovirus-related Pol poly from transposon n=1 Tax=Paramuricea clavata TaxID=317549 RepID=A0A6S7GGK7_PARCT|nr:Retrovirus-related Pol poly from transposon [Paramuricea clavata]